MLTRKNHQRNMADATVSKTSTVYAMAGQRAAAALHVAQLQRMVALLLLAVGLWFAWLLLSMLKL